MTSPSKQLKGFKWVHDRVVRKRQVHPYNPGKDMKHKKRLRPTNSSEVRKFNSLTFLACGKHRFSKAEMIPQNAHNDILVKEIKSAHDHWKNPSMKKRKTRNSKVVSNTAMYLNAPLWSHVRSRDYRRAWNVWLLCFSVPFSFAGEKVRFREENSTIWE